MWFCWAKLSILSLFHIFWSPQPLNIQYPSLVVDTDKYSSLLLVLWRQKTWNNVPFCWWFFLWFRYFPKPNLFKGSLWGDWGQGLWSGREDYQVYSRRSLPFWVSTAENCQWGMKSSMWSVRHGCLLSRQGEQGTRKVGKHISRVVLTVWATGFIQCGRGMLWGALYKKLRFVNVRNVVTNFGVGMFTWIFMV